ncbi:MAG: hypothetical protein ACFFAK_17420 [Promethearchaeota archaeon]
MVSTLPSPVLYAAKAPVGHCLTHSGSPSHRVQTFGNPVFGFSLIACC